MKSTGKLQALSISVFVIAGMNPVMSYAQTLSCRFDKFHQLNHSSDSLSAYVKIDQRLDIADGLTTDSTRALEGRSRAANSIFWKKLEKLNNDGWETFSTHYVGDFGELLTVKHNLGENVKGLDGTYAVSLVSSDVDRTLTTLGVCSISRAQ